MKKPLSQGTIIGTLVAVVIVVVVVAFIVYKPSIGAGPEVKPQKFKPPSGFDASKMGGGPIGAPKGAAGAGAPK